MPNPTMSRRPTRWRRSRTAAPDPVLLARLRARLLDRARHADAPGAAARFLHLAAAADGATGAAVVVAGAESTSADGITVVLPPDGAGARPAAGATPRFPGAAGATPQQQLEALLTEHGAAVYRVALSVVRDPVLAEDVSQDALLKAWQALPGFRGESPLRNWVLRIAHNTAVSTLRRRREELVDPAEMPERPVTDTLEHAVERRVVVDEFAHALDWLDALSRSIVVLREVEGISYDDISAMLDVPLPTVKTRLLRSRRVLATALDGWRP